MIKIMSLSCALLLLMSSASYGSVFLDKDSERVITKRACKLYASKQYTKEEIWDLTWNWIAKSANITRPEKVYTGNPAFDTMFDDYDKVGELIDRSFITKKTNSITKIASKCK